jgi:DNA-binding SARP family transcriptional activator
VKIGLLGPLEVVRAGTPIHVGPLKPRIVLALLAATPRRLVPASRLAEGLWGEQIPASATNLVQGYVAQLRKALGPDLIETRAPGYVLVLDECATDIEEFTALRQSAIECLSLGQTQAAASIFRDALALWRGPALADVAHSDVLARIAARLEQLRLATVEDRVAADLACGLHTELVAELEQLVLEEPYRERLWCHLVVGLYRCGRQADALRRCSEIRHRLVEELGVSPGPELREIEAAVLRQDHALDLDTSRLANRIVDRHAVFAGRHAELTMLRERWSRTRVGEHAVVLITGEPGIGKSRLASEVMHLAAADGARALRGHCEERVRAPYEPFVEAVNLYCQPGSGVAADISNSPHLEPLTFALPQLGPTLPGEERPPGDSAPTMLWIFDHFTGVLRDLAASSPVLLVLEDLQWADSTTLGLVHHLASQAKPSGLFIIGTYRDTEVRRDDPLRDLVADIRADAQCEVVPLAGLTTNEIELLIVGLDGEARRARAASLHDETGGNPLFVGEMLKQREEIANGDELPTVVTEAINRRVRRLSGAAQDVLAVASVIGDGVSLDLLRSVTLEITDFSSAVEETLDAGLFVETPIRAPTCRFSHSIIRRAIYDDLSAARRQMLHARVAVALETPLHRRDFPPAAVASHHRSAGNLVSSDRALRAYLVAAEEADRAWAKVEAVQWYDAALELLAGDDPQYTKVRLARFIAAKTVLHARHDRLSIARAATVP